MNVQETIDKINVYNLMIFNLIVFSILGIIQFGWINTIPQLLIAVFTSCLVDSLFIYYSTKSFRISKSGVISGFFIGLVLSNNQVWYVPLTASLIAIIGKHLGNYLMKYLKYNSHIFNPAIIGVFLSMIIFKTSDGWWGSTNLIAVFILGLFLLYKFKRFHLSITFLITYFAVNYLFNFNINFLDSTLYFFAMFMLTEPITAPKNIKSRIIYGVLSGVIIALMVNSFSGLFSGYSFTAGLLISNLFVPILDKI